MHFCDFKFVYVFITFIVLLSYNKVNSEQMNWSDAEKHCNRTGLYTRDSILKNNKVYDDLIGKLKNGDTLWVQEHVEYSPVLGYVGCLEIQANISLYAENVSLIEDDGFFKCVQHCANKIKDDRRYIAVVGSTCYCLLQIQYSEYVHSHLKKSGNDCDASRKSLFFYGQNVKVDQNVMIVYHSLPAYLISEHLNKNTSQCVYIKGSNNNDTIYTTGSCYEYTYSDGFVCGNRDKVRTNVIDKCNHDEMCLVQQHADVLSAALKCRDLGNEQRAIPIVTHQYKGVYLTGLFHVIKLTSQSNICLSLRKYNDSFVMEPGDCDTKRQTICQETATTVVDTETTVTEHKDIHQTTTDQQESDRRTNSAFPEKFPPYVMYIGASCAVLISIIIAVIVCIVCQRQRRRNNTKSTRESSQSPSDVQLLESHHNDESHTPVYAVPSKELKRNPDKINKPSKPQRKTIRNPPALSSYENFTPVETLKKQSKLNKDSEYDHINLNELPKDKNKVSTSDNKHVYNHTMDNIDDEYDSCTVKSAKGRNTANPELNNYSSLKDVQANTENGSGKTAIHNDYDTCTSSVKSAKSRNTANLELNNYSFLKDEPANTENDSENTAIDNDYDTCTSSKIPKGLIISSNDYNSLAEVQGDTEGNQ